jgi:glycosyltransferase involved in cell wall biosynthesis
LGAASDVKSRSATYFYHGTFAHRREIEFLVEVIRRVQSRLDHAHFEIMGGRRIRQLFKGIPRVRVLQSMAWPDFLAYTSSVEHAVGLAPMLDTHFNRGRSHNKLYDITRCGAAGVYSDIGVFRGYIRDGYNGLLSPNDPSAWVERICLLLTDEPKRAELYRNALADCEAHASDPEFRLR